MTNEAPAATVFSCPQYIDHYLGTTSPCFEYLQLAHKTPSTWIPCPDRTYIPMESSTNGAPEVPLGHHRTLEGLSRYLCPSSIPCRTSNMLMRLGFASSCKSDVLAVPPSTRIATTHVDLDKSCKRSHRTNQVRAGFRVTWL